MYIYTCLPEFLQQEFGREFAMSAGSANSLDIERVERDVGGGTFEYIVVDPAEVSAAFLTRLLRVVESSASTLIMWTAFESRVLTAIVVAGKAPRVEVFFRGDVGDAVALRHWLRAKGRETARAAVLRRLSTEIAIADPKCAHLVHGVLLGRFHEISIPMLLESRGLQARWLERKLQRSGLCRGRSLMHLGRLVTAFDCISSTTVGVAAAARTAGYASQRALLANAHRFIGCSPTMFKRLTAQSFAERVVSALRRERGYRLETAP